MFATFSRELFVTLATFVSCVLIFARLFCFGQASIWHARFLLSASFTVPVFLTMKVLPLFAWSRSIVEWPIL